MQAVVLQLAAHSGSTGAGIEREVKRAQAEVASDTCGRSNRDDIASAEQRHLQTSVFLQFEAVICRDGLADGEPNLLVAIVNTSPLRRRCRNEPDRWRGCRRRLQTTARWTTIAIVATQAHSTRSESAREIRRGTGRNNVMRRGSPRRDCQGKREKGQGKSVARAPSACRIC